MKVVVSHPTGNRNVRGVISSLLSADMLAEFNTTISIDPNAAWLGLFPSTVRRELLRRTFPIESKYIKKHPLLEISRMLFPKVGIKSAVRHEKGWASVDSVYRNMDKIVAQRLQKLASKENIKAVYAYEDGALQTFVKAKELGITCIYDLPIAYWETGRKLMMEEAARLPQWASTLGGGIKDSQFKLERKQKELELANIVVGPGQFVMDSIPEWGKNKLKIVAPFGSPDTSSDTQRIFQNDASHPLRVLFVGSLGQRKGLGDLFAAIKKLNSSNVELVVMGSLLAPMEFYKKELNNFTYEQGRPHDEVLKLMRSCDVFCLPSIVEGRALVMQEAMSQGLPVIITKNTGGEDLVIEGETGFIVPIRSPEKIAEKIEWFVCNRDKIPEMGKKAIDHSRKYTWGNYGMKIVNGLVEYLK